MEATMALVEVGGIDTSPVTLWEELRELLKSKRTAASYFFPVPAVSAVVAGVATGGLPLFALGLVPLTLVSSATIHIEAMVNQSQTNAKRRAQARAQAKIRNEAMEMAALSSRHAISDLREHWCAEGPLANELGKLAKAVDEWDGLPAQPNDEAHQKLNASIERMSKSCGMIIEDPSLLDGDANYYELTAAIEKLTIRITGALLRERPHGAYRGPRVVSTRKTVPQQVTIEHMAA
jgi:hypothetical protein